MSLRALGTCDKFFFIRFFDNETLIDVWAHCKIHLCFWTVIQHWMKSSSIIDTLLHFKSKNEKEEDIVGVQ